MSGIADTDDLKGVAGKQIGDTSGYLHDRGGRWRVEMAADRINQPAQMYYFQPGAPDDIGERPNHLYIVGVVWLACRSKPGRMRRLADVDPLQSFAISGYERNRACHLHAGAVHDIDAADFSRADRVRDVYDRKLVLFDHIGAIGDHLNIA